MSTDLIDKLWGEGSIHGFVGCKPVNGQFTQQAVSSSQDARDLISTLATRGDVYYSPATFRTGQSRQANNVLSLQAFFMDIDCGADKAQKGTGYPNKSAAKEALVEFCSVTGIPTPTEIVDSGNGLHCYWPLDRDIPVETWSTHAKHLKQLATYHGLLADKSVTADPARMLRVPGTLNLKDPQHPKPVALKRSGGSFSTDKFLALIEQAYKKISATDDQVQIDIPSGNILVVNAVDLHLKVTQFG